MPDCGHGWRNDNDCDVCRPPAVVVAGLRGRITELEAALRNWRDNYQRIHDDAAVPVPIHQIESLIGEQIEEC